MESSYLIANKSLLQIAYLSDVYHMSGRIDFEHCLKVGNRDIALNSFKNLELLALLRGG